MIRSIFPYISAAILAITWPVLNRATETGGDLPWNQPLTVLKDNLTGPTATVIILIAIAFGFAVWSFSDDNRGLFRAFKAIVALAVVAAIGGGFLGTLGINASLV